MFVITLSMYVKTRNCRTLSGVMKYPALGTVGLVLFALAGIHVVEYFYAIKESSFAWMHNNSHAWMHNNSQNDSRRFASKKQSAVFRVVDGKNWSEIDIFSLFGPPNITMGKGLVVVPGHGGDVKRREILIKNIQNIPSDRFDCIVFLYDYDDRDNLELGGCKTVYKKGEWVQFQLMIKPELVLSAGYTSVTLMQDDVLIAPPEFIESNGHNDSVFERGFLLDLMRGLLLNNTLSSISPNIFASDHAAMQVSVRLSSAHQDNPKLTVNDHKNGFIDARLNEIQLVMFQATGSGWPCYYSLLDQELNPSGWGTDICYKAFCNASLGLADAPAIHYGRPSVFGGIASTVSTPPRILLDRMFQWALTYKRNHARLSDWPDDGQQIINQCKQQ